MTKEYELGWPLGVVFREWHRRTSSAVEDLPHGPRGFQVLDTVERLPSPRLGALAAHLGIDRTVFTYVVDDLVTAELLDRTPDPRDRRAQQLVLTDVGRRRVGELRARVAAGEQQILASLSSTQQAEFVVLLNTIATHLDDDEHHDACRVVQEIVETSR